MMKLYIKFWNTTKDMIFGTMTRQKVRIKWNNLFGTCKKEHLKEQIWNEEHVHLLITFHQEQINHKWIQVFPTLSVGNSCSSMHISYVTNIDIIVLINTSEYSIKIISHFVYQVIHYPLVSVFEYAAFEVCNWNLWSIRKEVRL